MMFRFDRPFSALREKLCCREDRLEKLLKRALPIVEREALGTRPTKETWNLLEQIKKEVNG